MQKITGKQQQILEALATYRFLTTTHIMRLGIIKHRNHAGAAFRALADRTKPLTASQPFAIHPTKGRLPNAHYLTKHGVELLVEELRYQEENIKYPIGNTSLFSQDYMHRMATIDCHINFRQSAISSDFEIDFFDAYFDKVGANRGKGKKRLEAQTKIEIENGRYLIADGAGRFFDGEKDHLFLFEMYNGKDTKRVIEKLGQHQEALEMGTPTKRYKHDRGHRLLCVFELESELHAVARRMKQHPEFHNTKMHYLFKTLDQVHSGENFFTNWLDYDLNRHNLTSTPQQPKVKIKELKQPQAEKEQPKQQEEAKKPEETAQPSKKRKGIKWW